MRLILTYTDQMWVWFSTESMWWKERQFGGRQNSHRGNVQSMQASMPHYLTAENTVLVQAILPSDILGKAANAYWHETTKTCLSHTRTVVATVSLVLDKLYWHHGVKTINSPSHRHKLTGVLMRLAGRPLVIISATCSIPSVILWHWRLVTEEHSIPLMFSSSTTGPETETGWLSFKNSR